MTRRKNRLPKVGQVWESKEDRPGRRRRFIRLDTVDEYWIYYTNLMSNRSSSVESSRFQDHKGYMYAFKSEDEFKKIKGLLPPKPEQIHRVPAQLTTQVELSLDQFLYAVRRGGIDVPEGVDKSTLMVYDNRNIEGDDSRDTITLRWMEEE